MNQYNNNNDKEIVQRYDFVKYELLGRWVYLSRNEVQIIRFPDAFLAPIHEDCEKHTNVKESTFPLDESMLAELYMNFP